MPTRGEIVVPEKHWFIWPSLVMNGGHNLAETNLTAAWLQTAMIAENKYIGKPYRHWFGRRQLLP